MLQALTVRTPRLGSGFRQYGIIIAFLALCVVVAALCQYKVIQGEWSENTFLTAENLLLILYQISVNGILAIGMTLVVISAGIDLSVGSVLALSGMLAASFATRSTTVTAWAGTYPVLVPVLAALAIGSACGALNGWIIARFRIQAFIATLGMLLAARGMTMALTGANPISALSPDFRWFGTERILGIPVPILIFLLVFAGAWVLLNLTVFGRYVYAVGGNEKSARTSGIKTDRIIIGVYALSGLLAGIAGIILTAKTGSGQTNAGSSYELDAIAAAVIGGTSLAGGVGKLGGTLIGALIIGVMNNGLDLLGVESFYQLIIKGVLIVSAVIVDSSRKAEQH
ncbi:ribose ABC transporter membrane subunit [Rhodovastum atsumiense]|uniref:ABC transporter permease n=1 Tax=Rhodovastum atsumiense TaxID=504468 RepID=A0A5M6ISZ8_9PROT|nr:ABC transporter permease [Rhodovastum atsumiense]KAA5610688.1 ABC transporter permease [Rhodovastum atsumiense]CAH2603313.1 ribose ABC transporter membrane subunit [Rhodovastum atsumiense]